jgi:sentrin-specific protease 1
MGPPKASIIDNDQDTNNTKDTAIIIDDDDRDTNNHDQDTKNTKETAIIIDDDDQDTNNTKEMSIIIDVDQDTKESAIIVDQENNDSNNPKPSKRQLLEWILLVQRGMLRAPCTYCLKGGTGILPFSVFVQSSFQNDVTTLKLKEPATDGSTHVVSIFGEAWRKPGLRGPLARFRKHLKMAHGLLKEEFPRALSMAYKSTGLKGYKDDLKTYKSNWRKMRLSHIHEYTRRRQGNAKPEEVAVQLQVSGANKLAAQRRVSAWRQPLTPVEAEIVQSMIYGQGLIPSYPVKFVHASSLNRLAPETWLNDELIAAYFQLVSKRDEILCGKESRRKRSYIYSSYFWAKLIDYKSHTYCYNEVDAWSKKVQGGDIFSLGKLFIPINMGGTHWQVIVAFMQEHRIQMYDSMGRGGRESLRIVMQYIQDEHQKKKGIPLPSGDSWTLVDTSSDTPSQRNGFDCGVFLCLFVDFISINSVLLFSQEDVHHVRQRLALSLAKGKICF